MRASTARAAAPSGRTPERANLRHVRALNELAQARGQSLAQMATAWVLRDARVSSALIGASRPAADHRTGGGTENLHFSADELAAIDQHAVDGGINLWQRSSSNLTRTE
jgi:L-glyceraldehyde 3-phosphate reductase